MSRIFVLYRFCQEFIFHTYSGHFPYKTSGQFPYGKKLKKFIRIPDIFHIEKNRKKKIPTYSEYSPDIKIIKKNPDGRFDHFLGQKIDIFRTFLNIPGHFW